MFTLKNSLPCLIAFLIFSTGCKKNTTTTTTLLGDYSVRSSLNGAQRSNATGFSIGTKGYVAAGITANSAKKLNDLWEYDVNTDAWTQKANFPGAARYDAAGFSIGNNGYVGTGWDGANYFKDFYRYNSLDNDWDIVADFPVDGRQGSISFGIAGMGYVGTGNDGSTTVKDFWMYNPEGAVGSWSEITSIIDKRTDALVFTVDDKAYIGMGSNNGLYLNDFYKYDPATGWERLTSAYPAVDVDKNGSWDRDIRRAGAVAFTINNKGFIATGNYNGNVGTTWVFDPADNSWNQKSNFEGAGRTDAVGLSIGNRGFVVSGKNGAAKYDDMWEFLPDNIQE